MSIPVRTYQAIVIGVSSGGLSALKTLLPGLPEGFSIPVFVVQHLSSDSEGTWIEWLNHMCKVRVKEADEKEQAMPGHVYIAPPNYHMLIETDHTISLSSDEKVNYARPSIDVLFESASIAYGPQLIGIILTGSSTDGTRGMQAIKEMGGLTVVQDPIDAESPYMPLSVISALEPDYVLSIRNMIPLLASLHSLSKTS